MLVIASTFLMLFEKAILPNTYEINIILSMLQLRIEPQRRTWSQPYVTKVRTDLGSSNHPQGPCSLH